MCVTLAFVINPFLPILALEQNKKTNQFSIKNNLQLKSKLIQKVYKKKFNEEISEGEALTLAGNKLSGKNSYNSIRKFLKQNLIPPAPFTAGPVAFRHPPELRHIVPFLALDTSLLAPPAVNEKNFSQFLDGSYFFSSSLIDPESIINTQTNPSNCKIDDSSFTSTTEGCKQTTPCLIWKKIQPVYSTWNGANAYCAGFNTGNVSGWRLPTKNELLSAAGANRAYTHFFNVNTSDFYWSSDLQNTILSVQYWQVNLYNGTNNLSAGNGYVVCAKSCTSTSS